jgi:cytoskeletal protein RodZ
MSALVFPGLLAGCGNVINKWLPALNPSPPKQAPSRPRSETSSESRPERREATPVPTHETVKKETATHAEPAAEEPETAVHAQPAAEVPASVSITNATVTLGNGDATKTRAEHLLSDTDLKLAKVDRSKLTGQQATVYEQATGFADAARKALEQRDYLAASSLAAKASLLADKVAPGTSAQ